MSVPWNGKQEKFWTFNGEPIGHKTTASKMLALIQVAIDRHNKGIETFDPSHFRPNSPLSLKQYSEQWLNAADVCKNTKKVYRHAIGKAMEYFGAEQDIRQLSHTNLLLFKKSLNMSNDAIYNIMSALKTMLRFYKQDRPEFILPIFPPMSKVGKEPVYLTFEEQETVLKAIPERHRPIYIIMMEYGIRPQEATALKWDCITDTHITFKRSHSEYELRETTKTGNQGVRTELITSRAKDALGLSKLYPSWKGWVFSHNTRGSHYDNKLLNRIWKNACSVTGVKIGLYEAVRHSLGCQLADAGYPLDFIQDVYQHTSLKTTRRYAKRQRSMIADALENRGKVLEFGSLLEVKPKNS